MRRVVVPLLLVVGCSFGWPPAPPDAAGAPDGADGDGPPGDGPPAGACPAGYAPLPGAPANPHLYRRAPSNLTWAGQRDACAATAATAYLAIPNDAAELMGLAMVAGTTPFWVGISDQVIEGSYQTVLGGAATFLPWTTGQPDNAGGGAGQDCVAGTTTTISDEACTGGASIRPAVCECEP